MIRTHDFNSQWWGSPTGIVDDVAFFGLPESERKEALAQFEWVEFKAPLENPGVDFRALQSAGFFMADTQIPYRLKLTGMDSPPSLAGLDVEFADDVPFSVDARELMPFEHERYYRLPGATAEKVTDRYALWSQQHIERYPATCLRVLYKGEVQGWYLADESADSGLNLTLAMLTRKPQISGLLLFLRSYKAFVERGHRMGRASFSVQNTPVHNLYVSFGARFMPAVGCWLWVSSPDG